MDRPSLRSRRIGLEPMTTEHLPLLVQMDSDPEVLRHILGRARTADEVHEYWAPICADTTADAVGLGWWIGRRLRDGAFLGWWDLSADASTAPPLHAEAGWRLLQRHWGHGYATEGATAVLNHGFGTAGLDVV